MDLKGALPSHRALRELKVVKRHLAEKERKD
jgi:hypothetical protein